MLNLSGTPVPCQPGCSSAPAGECCGEDHGVYYCWDTHCRCANVSGVVSCGCQPGFYGASCEQQVPCLAPSHMRPRAPDPAFAAQVEPETTWLAVILTVGTMLILFIAWGFRCRPDDYDDDEEVRERAAPRSPLLREQTDAAVAAASPPTPRGSNMGSTADSSTGAGEEEAVANRLCCVCLDRRIQVVVIPCGHACMCRKCSFKVNKCPVCRLDIQAQQRFYM